MSMLSVPLTGDLEQVVKNLVKSGYGSNKADVVRRAIKRLAEEQAVEKVLRASAEPRLKGDLREIAKSLKHHDRV